MGHRITYAIRQGGTVSLFTSRWGALTSTADMFWGPESTEELICSNQSTTEWYDDCWGEGGIALDYDTMTVAFFGVCDYVDEPEVKRLYERLAAMVWGAEWTVVWVDDMKGIAAQVGVDPDVVTNTPMAAEADHIGKGLEYGEHETLASVEDHEGSRDLVIDEGALRLLMLGPVMLDHLDKGMVFDDFVRFHATRPLTEHEEERPPLMDGFNTYLRLDRVRRAIILRGPDREFVRPYDRAFLGRTYSALWPGWSVEVADGGVEEHFASMGRELPPALLDRSPPVEPKSWPDEEDQEPKSFEECVVEIAGFLFESDEVKAQMAEFTQGLKADVEADAVGPVMWGEGVLDRVPASGPEPAGKRQRFEALVRALAAQP